MRNDHQFSPSSSYEPCGLSLIGTACAHANYEKSVKQEPQNPSSCKSSIQKTPTLCQKNVVCIHLSSHLIPSHRENETISKTAVQIAYKNQEIQPLCQKNVVASIPHFLPSHREKEAISNRQHQKSKIIPDDIRVCQPSSLNKLPPHQLTAP